MAPRKRNKQRSTAPGHKERHEEAVHEESATAQNEPVLSPSKNGATSSNLAAAGDVGHKFDQNLFTKKRFYFDPHCLKSTVDTISDLIVRGGGRIAKTGSQKKPVLRLVDGQITETDADLPAAYSIKLIVDSCRENAFQDTNNYLLIHQSGELAAGPTTPSDKRTIKRARSEPEADAEETLLSSTQKKSRNEEAPEATAAKPQTNSALLVSATSLARTTDGLTLSPLIELLSHHTGFEIPVVCHALFVTSGNFKRAIQFLLGDADLDPKFVWSQSEDQCFLGKSDKEKRQQMEKNKGKQPIQEREFFFGEAQDPKNASHSHA